MSDDIIVYLRSDRSSCQHCETECRDLGELLQHYRMAHNCVRFYVGPETDADGRHYTVALLESPQPLSRRPPADALATVLEREPTQRLHEKEIEDEIDRAMRGPEES